MIILIFIFWSIFYISFQSISIYGGDGGDLVTAAFVGGIPHPPGFPLYTFLGFLLSKLPFLTVAWRVGILSSIPSAFTLVFIYLSLLIILKKKIPALIAIFTLGFSYVFWLYASIPEVFGLNSLFASILIYLLLKYWFFKKLRYFVCLIIFFGIAVAHHQFILVLAPAFLYIFFCLRKTISKINILLIYLSPLLFIVGFIPYIYSYFSARSIPLLSWNNPDNISNLIKLITRQSYGSFLSGASIAQSFHSRLIQIPVYFSFVINDFTLVGFLLIILGLTRDLIFITRSKKNNLEIFLLLCFIFSGPLFYFYGSYLITNQFQLGIYEKFLTLSYIFLSYYIARGVIFAGSGLFIFFQKFTSNFSKIKNISDYLILIFLILPISLFYINYPKIFVIKNDLTAEKLAKDILVTVKKNGILILERDNPLFNTQYLNLVEKNRIDVKVFQYQKLFLNDYKKEYKKYHPELVYPEGQGFDFVFKFIDQNYTKYPIYSITILDANPKEDYYWIRVGLLYRLYKKKDLPKVDSLIAENNRLWGLYSNPLSGSLGKYQNLLLSNVLVFYEDAHRENAELLYETKHYKDALGEIEKAIELDIDNPENYFVQAKPYYFLKQCDLAEKAIKNAEQVNPNRLTLQQKLKYISFEIEIYKSCFNDEKKAREISGTYEKLKSKEDIQLEKIQ